MLRIPCPWCGERNMVEFTYGGDASRPHPGLAAEPAAYFEHVYLRANPRGPHLEYWHHVNGCRQWLKVKRDTLSHEIQAAMPAATPGEAEA